MEMQTLIVLDIRADSCFIARTALRFMVIEILYIDAAKNSCQTFHAFRENNVKTSWSIDAVPEVFWWQGLYLIRGYMWKHAGPAAQAHRPIQMI